MKKTSIELFLIIVFLLVSSLYSQSERDTTRSIFEFRWSNDFEYQTDYYYTNGFAIEYLTPQYNYSCFYSILLPSKNNDKVLYGYTLVQDIFTPKAKFYIPDQLDGDRPFAAYILFGVKKLSYSTKSKVKLYSELQAGILGPAALGEQTQNGIHSLLPTSAEVNGWENQISNSFMLNYSASIQKYFKIFKHLEVSGFVLGQLGLPYTNLGVGAQAKLGVFNAFPEKIKYFSQMDWELYMFFSGQINVVGYNATLQGGVFSKSFYTLSNISRIVGKAYLGFNFGYKKFNLKYSQQFITPEFSGGINHSWGFLSITYMF